MADKQFQHFIIGGTIKAATSSLFNYISAHPQVCGSRVKETYFFSGAYSGNSDLDAKNYASFFAPGPDHRILLEASPNYLAYKENIAPRIRQLLPEAKILFVLRDPVERLYSHFNFARGKLMLPDDMGFERFVDLCEGFNKNELGPAQAGIPEMHLRALEIGNYARYLENYYAAFDADRIKVIFFDDLKRNPLAVLAEISEFIDISPSFYNDYVMNKANVTFSARMKFLHQIALRFNLALEPVLRRRPGLKHRLVKLYKFFNRSRRGFEPMPENVRNRLLRYYAPANDKLKNLVDGQKMPPWLL